MFILDQSSAPEVDALQGLKVVTDVAWVLSQAHSICCYTRTSHRMCRLNGAPLKMSHIPNSRVEVVLNINS